MGRVNMKRVVLGGIVVALVVNVFEGVFGFLMKDEWEAALRNLGVQLKTGPAMFLPILWSIGVGVLAVWLYAAIRPRYGPGPKTAIRAALAVWAFSTVGFAIAMGSLGIFPTKLVAWMTVWSLFEVVVAMLVGASIYREDDSRAIS